MSHVLYLLRTVGIELRAAGRNFIDVIMMPFRKARARRILKSLLVQNQREELLRTLRNEHFPYYLLHALLATPSKLAAEILAEFYLGSCDDSDYLGRRVRKFRKFVAYPKIQDILTDALDKKEKKDRLAKEELERQEQKQAEAAKKEFVRRSAIQHCPNCGDNPETVVKSRDVDDGWVTHYWYACKKCGAPIKDGNDREVPGWAEN